MQLPTLIAVSMILKNQRRPGFTEPFHKVLFAIEQADLDGMMIPVWVHPAYPADQVEAVARCFLTGHLADLAQTAAAQSTLTSAEADALWQSVKPPTIDGAPT